MDALVDFGKVLLRDNLCSQRYNSISGHYFFYIFIYLTEFLIFIKAFEVVENHNRRVLLIPSVGLFSLSLVVMISQLVYTYTGGYHTPRQIMYGSWIALAVSLCNIQLAIHYAKLPRVSYIALDANDNDLDLAQSPITRVTGVPDLCSFKIKDQCQYWRVMSRLLIVIELIIVLIHMAENSGSEIVNLLVLAIPLWLVFYLVIRRSSADRISNPRSWL